MELSNILTHAQSLKTLLLAYDNSVSQLSVLDSKIQRLDTQIFNAEVEGTYIYSLHLQTQKSVIKGVKKMFQKYRMKKWEEIQELSALILQSQDPSHPSDYTLPPTQPEIDTMATELTEMFCVYSRTA